MKAESLRVGDVVVEELDVASLSDPDVDALTTFENAIRVESMPDDPPLTAEMVRDDYENWADYVEHRVFVARTPDGEIVGEAEPSWARTKENAHLVQTELDVHPDHRRRGIGTALLRCVADLAEAAGRSTVMAVVTDRVPAGEAFAKRIGARVGLSQHINRVVIDEVDREMVRRWIDEGPARAPGYSLVAVDGTYPDDLIADIVDLHKVMNTAPREDLEMDDWEPTPEQARQNEAVNLATGLERWYLAARHDESGRLVGWTEVGWVPETPRTVWQWGTGVRPEHRGHALGKWLKAVMLERIMNERPDVIDVRTGNADSNAAMLGINHALGFKPYQTYVTWQVKVDRVKDYLAGSST